MMHRLIVVRADGISYTSDFDGWHAETGAFHYFREAQGDKRTLYATVLHGRDATLLSPRAEWSKTAVELAEAMKGE